MRKSQTVSVNSVLPLLNVPASGGMGSTVTAERGHMGGVRFPGPATHHITDLLKSSTGDVDGVWLRKRTVSFSLSANSPVS